MRNNAPTAPLAAALALDSAQPLLFGGLPPHPALFRVRVTRAELAQILGCSKPTITRWAQAGRLVFAPDGRIDAAEAVRQILRTADPRVLRTGIFRQAMAEVGLLRAEAAKAASVGAELATLREALAGLQAERDRLAARLAEAEAYGDGAAARLFAVSEAVRAQVPAIERASAPAAAALAAALREVEPTE